MDPKVEKFWKKREAEIGEAVRAFALARILRAESNARAPRWGLVYCTDTRVFFQRFEQTNWIGALMTSMRRDRISDEDEAPAEGPMIEEIHLAAFRGVAMPDRTWWQRLMRGPQRIIVLIPSHRERDELRIEVLDTADGLRAALETSIERAQLG